MKTHAKLKAAFPWFDQEAWAWHYEPALKESIPSDAADGQGSHLGKISIYMPGASPEQYEAVKAWLVKEFNPTRLLPGPEYVGEFASVTCGGWRTKSSV